MSEEEVEQKPGFLVFGEEAKQKQDFSGMIGKKSVVKIGGRLLLIFLFFFYVEISLRRSVRNPQPPRANPATNATTTQSTFIFIRKDLSINPSFQATLPVC